MARIAARPEATAEQVLEPLVRDCPACGRRMWADYDNHRTVTTLSPMTRTCAWVSWTTRSISSATSVA